MFVCYIVLAKAFVCSNTLIFKKKDQRHLFGQTLVGLNYILNSEYKP